MKLVTFEVEGRERAGVLEGDDIIALGASMKEVIASGKMERGSRYRKSQVKLRAPVPDPAIVLSVGMNYHEHLAEMNTPVPEKPAVIITWSVERPISIVSGLAGCCAFTPPVNAIRTAMPIENR